VRLEMGPPSTNEIGATCVVSIAFFINRVLTHVRGGMWVEGVCLVPFFLFKNFPRAMARKKQVRGESWQRVPVGRVGEKGGWNKCPTYDPVRIIRKSLHRRWSKSASGVHSSACVWHCESKYLVSASCEARYRAGDREDMGG
jgi:hypothetical protein